MEVQTVGFHGAIIVMRDRVFFMLTLVIMGFAVCAVAARAEDQPSTNRNASIGVVRPVLPRLWRVDRTTRSVTRDYAKSDFADAWLRHPILGDPSFDSFVRDPGNPIVTGTPPFVWPVNVSLLDDPVSGCRYAYVGQYLDGYNFGIGLPITHCDVFRSSDQGKSWQLVGPIFNDPKFRFEGDAVAANIAPDVKVIYCDGLYHMAYDWCTDNTTWANASSPRDGADSGCAYAWSEKPEGPFHRAPQPILRTSEIQKLNHGSSRYCRVYATSIVRRKNDWLVLTDLDSGAHFAWGQAALTTADPRGQWSAPSLIASLETDRYYPAPVEAFPAFAHDGYVYDPRTSVGHNRNFQIIMRAPIERAHQPEAWELYQHGSVWHAEAVPNEAFGIWGQALAASISDNGEMRVLFPSRRADGVGTINAAHRAWNQPFRTSGFTLSAHGSPSLTVLRAAYQDFDLHTDFFLSAGTVRFAWGFHAPLGEVGRADGIPNEICRTRQCALVMSQSAWRLIKVREAETYAEDVIAHGDLPVSGAHKLHLHSLATKLQIEIDGNVLWSGQLTAERGPLALYLEPGTHVEVTRFTVAGNVEPAVHTWLGSEAAAGSGVAEGTLARQTGQEWRYGHGIVCTNANERAKWNFRGRGFQLWSPRGPEFSKVEA